MACFPGWSDLSFSPTTTHERRCSAYEVVIEIGVTLSLDAPVRPGAARHKKPPLWRRVTVLFCPHTGAVPVGFQGASAKEAIHDPAHHLVREVSGPQQ